MKKLYYRLDELQDRYGIYSYDIRYLMEREQLPLCFYRPQKIFIAGKNNDYQFSAYGHVAYFGLIELESLHADYLLDEGYTESKYCSLLERNNIESLGTDCPRGIKPPHNDIAEWLFIDVDEMDEASVFALENNTAVRVEGVTEKPDSGYLMPIEGQDASIHINFPYYRYEFRDLVVQHKTLVELGLFDDEQNTKETSERSKSPFHRLIEHLIKSFPQKRASELWSILKNTWEQDDDIDPESILAEVNERSLV